MNTIWYSYLFQNHYSSQHWHHHPKFSPHWHHHQPDYQLPPILHQDFLNSLNTIILTSATPRYDQRSQFPSLSFRILILSYSLPIFMTSVKLSMIPNSNWHQNRKSMLYSSERKNKQINKYHSYTKCSWVQTHRCYIMSYGSEPRIQFFNLWVKTHKCYLMTSGSKPRIQFFNIWVQTHYFFLNSDLWVWTQNTENEPLGSNPYGTWVCVF